MTPRGLHKGCTQLGHAGRMHTRSRGRGFNYTARRGALERSCELAWYGDWPARLRRHLPDRPLLCSYRLPLLAPGSAPLRIGFASDLHLGPTTPSCQVEAGLALLNDAALDVLLLGGDYVFLDATAQRAQTLARLISSVRATTKLAVMGNHDLWTDHPRLERALEQVGVQVLVNQRVRLPSPHGDVSVIGLDEPWTGQRDPTAALDRSDAPGVRVVLCHSPDGLGLLEPVLKQPVDLFVCGHTHGGHIALPRGIPMLLPPGPYQRPFAHGLRSGGSIARYVHTSRGLGNTELPFRAFAPPDVALFELVPGGE